MAPPSDNPGVFGPQYVSGVPVNIMVDKGSGEYRLMKGNEEGGVFTVQQFNTSHNRMLMLQNPEKAPVALLEEEGHAKWNTYSCENGWKSEKIFSISKHWPYVKVSLSINGNMDYLIKGSMSERNCTIYTGNLSTIIAQMRPLGTNDKVMVDVYPNVDCAFVVALIVIVDAMKIDEPYPTVMAQPNDESPVIVPQYISDDPVNLLFKKVGPHEYVVFKDGYEVFNIKSSHKIFHKQWMVVGEDGKLVAMLQKKIMTGHSRWYVFRGESEADPKRFFSVCKDHMIQRKTVLNVMLEKGSGAAIDYKVEGSWTNKACTIYKGDSSTDIAEMRALEEDKENFMVKVYPNVDYSFVVALIAVVAAMKSPRKLKVAAAYGVDLTIKFASGAAVAVGQIVVEGLL